MKVLALVGLIAGSVRPLVACDLCSVYAAPRPEGAATSGLFAGVAEQFTYFNTLQVEGHEVPNVGNQYLNSSISQVYAGYNFTERIGVQFNMPVVYRDYGYQAQRGSNWGLGDVSLLGSFHVYQKTTDTFSFDWTALGGVKFPTGNSSLLNPDQPDFAPGIGGHDLALGSGSFDGLVGTGFFARWKRLFLAADMQYFIRSQGDFGYQFANDWLWSGGPGFYVLQGDKLTLSVQAIVSGESKGEDTIYGTPTEDTAITAVYLGPQINLTWSRGLSAFLGGDLPVGMVASGEQVVPNYRIRGGFAWHF